MVIASFQYPSSLHVAVLLPCSSFFAVLPRCLTAAVTTDYDTLLQVFPTKTLVQDAQRKLEDLLASGTSPESATQQIYDLLIQKSTGPRNAAAAAAQFQATQGSLRQVNGSFQAVNITAMMAKVDVSSTRKVSSRRVEFSTVDSFPCMVLATADYSASVLGGSKCRTRSGSRLLLYSSAEGASQQQQQQQQQAEQLQANDGLAAAAAAAAAPVPAPFSRHSKPIATQLPPEAGSFKFPSRSVLQDTPPSQCSQPKGLVLVLSPFYAENSCSYKDESAEIAALFQAQGYSVTFTCNDLTVCPEGPPSLDDFIGWSKHAFVAVSTIGDADESGEEPIILSRAPTDFSEGCMNDWRAGRMVLTGDGLFALR
jgi:hypothetical protein